MTFVVPASLKAQAQGVEGGDLKLTLAVSDVNKKQDINPPANPRPWSELQKQFGSSTLGGLGGLGGSSGTGSSSSGSGSSSGIGSSKRTQRYLKCVQKAKTTQDVTACGSILGR